MKKVWMFFGFLVVLNLTIPVYSEEGDQLEALKKKPSSLPVQFHSSSSASSKEKTTAQARPSVEKIDRIGEFLLEIPNATADVYDLFFYRDGILEDTIKAIRLPYLFKQNFAGLNPGNYQLMFMLVDTKGNVGRIEKTITVQHNP